MALPDDTPRVKAALAIIPGIHRVTESWPKEEEALPCISLTLDSLLPHEHYDNKRFSTELTYDIRLFAVTLAQRRELSSAIDDVMLELGYLMGSVDHENEPGRLSIMRYSKILGG